MAKLRCLATLFLAQKEFTGGHGFEVTDEIAVSVAAQACLPILRLGLRAYAGFVGIVMHSDAVLARREVTDDAGVVHHYDETLSGEAMEGGPVMLSWPDVAAAGESAEWGYNVVIHEFAHVLAASASLEKLRDEYSLFCARADAGDDTLLDPYGAESLDEFFAVVSEVFFVSPADLLVEHPQLYQTLTSFYQQDPAVHWPHP